MPPDLAAAFRDLVIEIPSCLAVAHGPGRPREVFARLDDAAEVHRQTGTAGAVELQLPWDAVEDYEHLAQAIRRRGLRVGAINPDLVLDPDFKPGSLTSPDPALREHAVSHLLACVEIATALGSDALSLWLADGTKYAGQDDLRARRRRMLEGLARVYAALAPAQELLVDFKPFERGFHATDLADWGSALLACLRLGDRANVLVDLGHHAGAVSCEQIVALLADEGRLGAVRFNHLVGAANPFELFVIFVELTALPALPRLAIERPHSIEAMVLSVVNLQEAYAKALLVDRAALCEAQDFGDALYAHEVLLDAFRADVRAACAAARAALGAPDDPVFAVRQSDYAERAQVLR